MLTLDGIHNAKDFKEKIVSVPEWGDSVKIRTLSMGARYNINEVSRLSVTGGLDQVKFAAATLAHGIVEPKMTFEDAMKIIANHTFEPIQMLADEIWKLSGLLEPVAKNE